MTKVRVRQAREEQGLSQGDLALRAGLPQSTICGTEKGRDPRVTTIAAIARALDVPVDSLIVTDAVVV